MPLRTLATFILAGFIAACSASAAEGPNLSARLYCTDGRGAAVPMKTGTFGDLVAAFARKFNWKHTARDLGQGHFEIVFSPADAETVQESATFAADQTSQGLIVNSVDYLFEGDVEHVGPGLVCFKLINLLSH